MVEDDEYGCSAVGVVAGACCLTEDGCLAVPGLVTGICCLLEDGPLEVVRLQTGVGFVIDDFLAELAFGDIGGFLTLVLVFEDDAVVHVL